jgi:hypothetical protein
VRKLSSQLISVAIAGYINGLKLISIPAACVLAGSRRHRHLGVLKERHWLEELRQYLAGVATMKAIE